MSKKTKGCEDGVVKDTSPKVYQREKISFTLPIRERDDLTDKQKSFLDIILDKKTKIVFLRGPSGVSKTFIGVLSLLKLLNNKRISDIYYIRSIAESASKSLGSLPGGMDDKLEPFLMPLVDKLNELLPKNIIDRLVKEERIHGVPINYLRGANFSGVGLITDESQNLTTKEMITLITRMGEFSKFIIAGDPMQSDINGHSGFNKFYDLFNDDESKENGIYCLEFSKEDIVRSGVLKYILGKIESMPINDGIWKPGIK